MRAADVEGPALVTASALVSVVMLDPNVHTVLDARTRAHELVDPRPGRRPGPHRRRGRAADAGELGAGLGLRLVVRVQRRMHRRPPAHELVDVLTRHRDTLNGDARRNAVHPVAA